MQRKRIHYYIHLCLWTIFAFLLKKNFCFYKRFSNVCGKNKILVVLIQWESFYTNLKLTVSIRSSNDVFIFKNDLWKLKQSFCLNNLSEFHITVIKFMMNNFCMNFLKL
jgi:hypothetical protein